MRIFFNQAYIRHLSQVCVQPAEGIRGLLQDLEPPGRPLQLPQEEGGGGHRL